MGYRSLVACVSDLQGTGQLVVIETAGRFEFLGMFPVVVASVALATVAGFVVAVLPGGLGVREGVLMVALGPVFGHDLAVVAALALPWSGWPPSCWLPRCFRALGSAQGRRFLQKRVRVRHDHRRRPRL